MIENKRAKSFVAIMIFIGFTALLLRFGIEKIIKINIAQNEAIASLTLKLISAALENYANDHAEVYPVSLSGLTQTKPPYLDKDYVLNSPLRGYIYSCSRLEPSGYSCSAIPVKCNLAGRLIYTVITGGSLISEECSKKEKE